MIQIFADYHTHTRHSHGSGSIEDNVLVALEKGLERIAIADHGVGHMFYNIKHLDIYLAEIAQINQKYAGRIEVLSSMEMNILSENGSIDLPDAYKNAFDIRQFGYHKMVRYHGLGNWTHFLLGSKSIRRNTQTYLHILEQYDVDVITHLGYGLPVDKIAVAKFAQQRNTALEINAKHPEFTVQELAACAETGVLFCVGSDAHSPQRVGDFTAALEKINEAGIPASQIINAREITLD